MATCPSHERGSSPHQVKPNWVERREHPHLNREASKKTQKISISKTGMTLKTIENNALVVWSSSATKEISQIDSQSTSYKNFYLNFFLFSYSSTLSKIHSFSS